MDIQLIQRLIQSETPDSWSSKLEVYGVARRVQNALENVKQYLVENHAITDKAVRKDKLVTETRKNEMGEDVPYTAGIVPVARLTLALQKKIVLTAAGFLGRPTMDASTEDEGEIRLLELMQKVWDDNKLDWKFMNISKKTMSEYHCAELWYAQDPEKGYWNGYQIRPEAKTLRMKVLAKSLGDDLFPIFDDYGAMIAFVRKYKTLGDEGKEMEHVDLYTAESFYFARRENGKWMHANEKGEYVSETRLAIPNFMKKIPVIYYFQPELEWQDVQVLIERLETKISNHADTNDYFDSPILLANGKIVSMSAKGDTGKVFELEGEKADMKYLTWDQAPESTRMEIENLIKFIHELTFTPDISFEAMKGLGAFSKVALDMFFIGARLKAAEKQEIFGESVQRRINFIKHFLGIVDPSLKAAQKLSIKPKFNSFLPIDDQEQISTLNNAVKGGLMSIESAVMQNPLLKDPKSELEKIRKEADEAFELETKRAGLNKPVPPGLPD
jgi:SPP1 family phage portal protein